MKTINTLSALDPVFIKNNTVLRYGSGALIEKGLIDW